MSDCIKLKTLARYIGNTLPGSDRDRVEEHLSLCRNCRKLFALASMAMQRSSAPEPPGEPVSEERIASILQRGFASDERPGLGKKAASVGRAVTRELRQICRWITMSPAEALRLHPGFAGVRSGDSPSVTCVRLSKNLGDIGIELVAEKTAEDRICFEIKVLKEGEHLKNIRLTLIREGGKIISRLLRGGSEFIENQPFGKYHLNLMQNSREKGNLFFEINETGLSER
ncbi:hypothetical protein DENIS_0584 [Desulfonema ishimotonii]|uniref:Putative zinc-finger domain-containing protein n=1 Tax=Desulfonema ishimotonii TaxID=45657 RepID=A0A401FRQ8_9BACT|nr:zf-HC2 domain-containing protein [Desulfonema ishimotonii]GBC59645.1 hypothetical protein DENIS_0584 [Desulfonema ishimotonii]